MTILDLTDTRTADGLQSVVIRIRFAPLPKIVTAIIRILD
jgi:hypothetical protein